MNSSFPEMDVFTLALSFTTCTNSTAFTLSFNAGSTGGATTAQRLMANGAETLQYNLYTDNTYATVLDATHTLSGTGAGPSSPQSVTFYAKAPKSQNVDRKSTRLNFSHT